jgi:hypothetical protein
MGYDKKSVPCDQYHVETITNEYNQRASHSSADGD